MFAEFMSAWKIRYCRSAGVMFGEVVRGAGCVGGQEKSGWDVYWTALELSVSSPTSVWKVVDDCSRGEGERRKTAKQGVIWIAA